MTTTRTAGPKVKGLTRTTTARGSKRFVITRGTPIHKGLIYGGLLLGLLAAIYVPYYFQPFQVFRLTLVIVYAIAVLGLNMLTGYGGQISLGHSAFFAVGAYTSAILIQKAGWNYLLTIPIAAAITFILGFIVGIPALRLQGLYLALVTLGLAVAAPPLIKRYGTLTGGSQGIVVRKPRAPEWTGLANDQWLYFVCLAVAVIMFLLAWNLLRGRVGRAVMGVRDNEIAAEAMGINLSVFKTFTFAYSAMFAGVAGALYTFAVAFVSPESFTVLLAVSLLAAVVVGGLASISGAMFGALFIQ